MMKNILTAFLGFALILTFGSSCNKSSLLGSELFETDKLNLSFLDTITIRAISEGSDSVPTFINGATIFPYPTTFYPFDQLLAGRMRDSFFGTTEARVFARFDATTPPSAFPNVILDSVTLELGYNIGNVYGDTLTQMDFGVYRLTEPITGNVIYSNKTFKSESTPLGRISLKPEPASLIRIIKSRACDTGTATCFDTTYRNPIIRIKLDTAFGRSLINLDTSVYKATDGFSNWLKGIEIRPENTTQCMLSLDMVSRTISGSNEFRGIIVYYRTAVTDTVSTRYVISADFSTRYNYFKHETNNGIINNFINKANGADSLIFLQGMSGPNVKMELPYLQSLNNKGKIVVNKAELELYIRDEDTKSNVFTPVERVLVTNGKFEAIRDLQEVLANNPSLTVSTGTSNSYGGYVQTKSVNGTAARLYRINMTRHIQRMIDGKEGSQLFLTPLLKQATASRVVFYGFKNAAYRPRINLTYTVLPK